MGYARSIGRIGALAVAMGVGVAVASTPGIAYAEPSSDTSSVSGSPSSTTSSLSTTPASSGGATAESSDTDSTAADPASSSGSDSADTTDSEDAAGEDLADDLADLEEETDVAEADGFAGDVDDAGVDDAGVDDAGVDDAGVDDAGLDDAEADAAEADAAGLDDAEADDAEADDAEADAAAGDAEVDAVGGIQDGAEGLTNGAGGADTDSVAKSVAGDQDDAAPAASGSDDEGVKDELADSVTVGETDDSVAAVPGAYAESDESDWQPATLSAALESATPSSVTPASELTTVSAAAVSSQAPARPLREFVTGVVEMASQVVAAVLEPLLAGPWNTPTDTPMLWALLAWARRELGQTNAEAASATQSPNLLVNPGAEFGDPSLSGNSSVTIPGWMVTGTPTVIPYGAAKDMWPLGLSFPLPNLPSFMGFPKASSGPPDGGAQFFGGGNVGSSTLTQTVDLSGAAALIDSGMGTFDLSAWMGGYLFNGSWGTVKVDFLDSNQAYLDGTDIGPGGPIRNVAHRFFHTELNEYQTSGSIPVGTRSAQVDVILTQHNPIPLGTNIDYNSAFADNISFTINSDLPAPPDPTPPVSTVGELDHFFMVMMENKGYNDILNSPDAPYLNSLINAYGLADNYYGLTHPSLPNYYPVIGGSDFGITYECETPCIPDHGTLLTDNLDDKGLIWRGYAQSQGNNPLINTDDYDQSQLPFMAFQGIADDVAYATEHQRPLSEMEGDLNSATPPNYLWIGANESYNGEGPVDTIGDVLKFLWSQITPGHQYNVPALDEFLDEYVNQILDSDVWNDSDKKSALVITFDEDNDNLSFGFGDELNHIVTVVIPSPGALGMPGDNPGEMREGHVVATDRYDHYSLMRTIEESLGLPPVTNNDKFAVPMNEFWVP